MSDKTWCRNCFSENTQRKNANELVCLDCGATMEWRGTHWKVTKAAAAPARKQAAAARSAPAPDQVHRAVSVTPVAPSPAATATVWPCGYNSDVTVEVAVYDHVGDADGVKWILDAARTVVSKARMGALDAARVMGGRIRIELRDCNHPEALGEWYPSRGIIRIPPRTARLGDSSLLPIVAHELAHAILSAQGCEETGDELEAMTQVIAGSIGWPTTHIGAENPAYRRQCGYRCTN